VLISFHADGVIEGGWLHAQPSGDVKSTLRLVDSKSHFPPGTNQLIDASRFQHLTAMNDCHAVTHQFDLGQ